MDPDTRSQPDQLDVRVAAWLNKSGFPLEMRVAKAFKDRLSEQTWDIETNSVYEDPATGVDRERDLQADAMVDLNAERGIYINIAAIVECKATTAPWVILKESLDTEKQQPLFTAFATRNPSVSVIQSPGQLHKFSQMLDRYFEGRLPGRPAPGYGIAEAFRKANDLNGPYSATRQVLSATEARTRRMFGANDPELTLARAYFFPVVITTSPLFEAALNHQSGEVEVRQVGRSAVTIRSRRYPDPVVSIVAADAIDGLLDDLEPLPREISNFLDIYDRSALQESKAPFKVYIR